MKTHPGASTRPTTRHVDRETIGPDHPDTAAPLRVVIAYGDIPAGRRAMNLLTQMLQRETNTVHLIPALWRFDLLEDPDWCERALADAVAADLLILATSKPHSIPTGVDRWVSALLSQRRGTGTAILAWFGSDDEWSISVQEGAHSPENAACFPSGRVRPMQSRIAAA
jgi:hypothetical protein